jgi:hypothetical protein
VFINPFTNAKKFVDGWISNPENYNHAITVIGNEWSEYYEERIGELPMHKQRHEFEIRIGHILEEIWDNAMYGKGHDEDVVDVYRSIVLFNEERTAMEYEEIVDFFNSLKNIGIFWTWEFEKAVPYWGWHEFDETEFGYTVKMNGEALVKYVDWNETVKNALNPDTKPEREITMVESRPIEVQSISIYDYEPESESDKAGDYIGDAEINKKFMS